MKPTMSKDGLMRIDIRVSHRVDLRDVINGLLYQLYLRKKTLDEMRSRKAIMDATRSFMASHGYMGAGLDGFLEEVETYDLSYEEVEEHVLKAFPELQPPERRWVDRMGEFRAPPTRRWPSQPLHEAAGEQGLSLAHPNDKTCSSCVLAKRCTWFLGDSYSPKSRTCDWAPSRYQEAT